jgi:hypothetical protein
MRPKEMSEQLNSGTRTGERTGGPGKLEARTTERVGTGKPAWLALASRDLYIDVALVGALGLLLVIFGIASGGKEFFGSNLINIVDSGSVLGVVTVGEAIVMISGNLDISVGSNAGLVTAVIAEVMAHTGSSLLLGLVAGVAAGLVTGAFNGFTVAYLRVNSVIATLATYSAYLGLALLVTGGQEVGVVSTILGSLGTGEVGPVPYLVIVAVVVAEAIVGSAARSRNPPLHPWTQSQQKNSPRLPTQSTMPHRSRSPSCRRRRHRAVSRRPPKCSPRGQNASGTVCATAFADVTQAVIATKQPASATTLARSV